MYITFSDYEYISASSSPYVPSSQCIDFIFNFTVLQTNGSAIPSFMSFDPYNRIFMINTTDTYYSGKNYNFIVTGLPPIAPP